MIPYLLSLAGNASAQSLVSATVDEVVSLYFQGKLPEAELLALRTLQSSDSLPPVDRAILHKTLGFTYVALGENEKAKNQFINWLEIDSLAKLDTVYVSPKIVAVFREAREEIEQQRTQQPGRDNPAISRQLQAVKRSLFFPGLGQIYQGRKVKGGALLAAEVVLLGSLAYCQFRYDQTRDDYLRERNPTRMQDLYDETNLYYRARSAAAILAAGVYLYSLYDAAYFPAHQFSESATLSLQISPEETRLLTIRLRF